MVAYVVPLLYVAMLIMYGYSSCFLCFSHEDIHNLSTPPPLDGKGGWSGVFNTLPPLSGEGGHGLTHLSLSTAWGGGYDLLTPPLTLSSERGSMIC